VQNPIRADVINIEISTSINDRIHLRKIEKLDKSTFLQLIYSGRLSLLFLMKRGNCRRNKNFSGGNGVQQSALCIDWLVVL